VKGIAFAIAAWLLMMVVFMPVAGARIFGAALGPEAAISTFVLHLLFGAVLGVTFGALTDSRRPSRLQQRRPSQRSAQEFEEPPVLSQRLARRLH
jgi:hypothetical protein